MEIYIQEEKKLIDRAPLYFINRYSDSPPSTQQSTHHSPQCVLVKFYDMLFVFKRGSFTSFT